MQDACRLEIKSIRSGTNTSRGQQPLKFYEEVPIAKKRPIKSFIYYAVLFEMSIVLSIQELWPDIHELLLSNIIPQRASA